MAFEIRSFNLRDVKGLSQAALNLHLDLYHGYVEQVNTLLEVLQPHESPSRTPALTREAAVRRFPFEYNGMVLHELFFEQLSGSKGRPPHEQGPLGQAVGHAFGGFDGWREDFERLAATRGVGWVMTVRERTGGTLYNTWIDEHQWGTTAGTDVIFLLDVWEHAYLLDFSPKQRSDYLQAVFDNVDWSVVESRMR
jgi:Fe-Mn family superoxide dismutase